MAKILLFGGSFDPIHLGHLIIGRSVAEALGVEQTVLLPSALPPHKRRRRLAPAADRLAMCRLAVRGDPQFRVDDWELRQRGPNYTLRTIRHFREALPTGTDICWLIGMDSLVELGTWYRATELVDACRVVTAARPGYERPDLRPLRRTFSRAQISNLKRDIVNTPRIDISATDVRRRVRAGESIRYLVPDAVRKYIERRGLYARRPSSQATKTNAGI